MGVQNKINIKMIVLDLDGTLLRRDKTISDYTISIIEQCKEKDISVVIATGRSEMAAKDYINKVKPDSVISNGGSLVRVGENIIHSCMLSAEISDQITSELMSKKEFVNVCLETETGYYVTYSELDYSDYAPPIYYDFKVPLSEKSFKIVAQLTNGEVAKEIAERYPNCSMIPFAGEDWYRFANKDSDKMDAIKETARHFNIDLSQVVSFGDDYNDIEMIKQCGVGVSMGNSIDEVKEVANYICDNNDNDGVAKWIDKYIL